MVFACVLDNALVQVVTKQAMLPFSDLQEVAQI